MSAIVLQSLAQYEPGAARPWNLAWAGHLFRRAGFGANWAQLQAALRDGPQRTVDRLLHPDAGISEFERRMTDLSAAPALSEAAGSGEIGDLWLYRILETPHPALEKMTLFWHNYFAVAGAHAGRASLVYRHLQTLRKHALGRFDALLRDVCRDPATLLALDAGANRKARPSEGFATALLGRYTLGPGAFEESDARTAARAFTGSYVLGGELRFLPHEHDGGVKTILGRAGNFNGEDVIGILLAHPATPRMVVRKLYSWLISETEPPAAEIVDELAGAFAKDYDIARLAGTILRSNLFFSPVAYRRRVKSPVEFAAGIVTALEAPVPAAPLHQRLAGLGQRLLEPPTRAGWPGGRNWLNRFTVVGRNNLAASLLAAGAPRELADKHGFGAQTGKFFAQLLVQSDAAEAVHAIVSSPEFQLA